jgi:tRNA modification GTPase
VKERGLKEDTIAAIATPLGEGGLGVIRMSGPSALDLLARVFKPNSSTEPGRFDSHKMYLGTIIDPQTGSPIDQSLAAYMRKPNSYTGEDVVELSCHGGAAVLNRALQAVISAGARPAGRGEFSKRAFLSGKIDLAQAEAIIDLVRAKTAEGAEAATRQLLGSLSGAVRKMREEILSQTSIIEASLDFPDDVRGPDRKDLHSALSLIRGQIQAYLATADAGVVMRNGVRTAIVGKPNVGKSSLLNALLRADRAIVSEHPGTTRDTIEETVNVRGIPLLIIDTAGLREPSHEVEGLGVDRAQRAAEEAELAILVIDASSPIGEEDRAAAERIKGKKALVVLNKSDKKARVDEKAAGRLIKGAPIYKTSALNGEGIVELEQGAFDLFAQGVKIGEDGVLINTRHKACLMRAEEALREGLETLEKGLQDDLVSIDLKDAIVALGEVVGEAVSEEIVDRIFSGFCVGK